MTIRFSLLVTILLFSFGVCNRASAQTVLPCTFLAASYGLDSTLVVDSTRLDSWLNEQADTTYANLSLQCSLLNTKVQHMQNSLRGSYDIKNDTLWLDSTACIVDHGPFFAKLDALSQSLLQRGEWYDQLEQQRIIEAQRAAEEAARAKVLAEQQARNDSAIMIKAHLEESHNRIGDMCDGIGVSDRTQQKRLKDIYYSYLSVYNQYDLSLTQPTTQQLSILEELSALQMHIIDSVLSPNSYHARIAQFPAHLRQHSSSGHKEVYKSYQRNMRNVEVPIHFNSISEYNRFVQMLKDVLTVQHLYIETVDKREEIVRNSTAVLKHASKRSEVQDSYKEALALVDQVPVFISIKEGEEFVQHLCFFTEVQGRYILAIDHLDSIDARGRRLVKQCKEYKDLTTAYKELCEVYDFTASFSTLEGADFFEKTLDDFEVLQDTYIHLLSLRQCIDRQDKQLKDNSLPRDVKSGYQKIKKLTKFKPDFTNVPQSVLFVENMNTFIAMQQQMLLIEEKQQAIENNLKQLKTMSKANAAIVKAYHMLRDEAEQKFEILSLDDLEAYIRYQERQLNLQGRFMEAIQSPERADYNRRLEGVRSSEKVHAIMNI